MSAPAIWLLDYLLNAVWQLPLVFAAALLLTRLGGNLGPRLRHQVWVAVLGLEIILPGLPPLHDSWLANLLLTLRSALFPRLPNETDRITVFLGNGTANTGHRLAGCWPLGLLLAAGAATTYFIAQLLWRLARLRGIRLRSRPATLPPSLESQWNHHCRRFRTPRARVALSADIKGPATVGLQHPLVLLPFTFLELSSQEDQSAALAHECAHIRRHDFARNLLYELLSLVISWHPLRHLTLARIAETREIVCDALAAEAVAGPERYARSLLRLAAATLAAKPAATHHAIGLCDAHTLERRIMFLTAKRQLPGLSHRFALATAAVLLTLATCTTATALHLGVAPQTSQPASDATGYRISGGVMAGQILSRVNPVYPPEARAAGISGSVVLQARIGKDGVVQNLSAISGPAELQAAAIDAVKQWVYRPYLLNGAPVEVNTTITVNYHLAK